MTKDIFENKLLRYVIISLFEISPLCITPFRLKITEDNWEMNFCI